MKLTDIYADVQNSDVAFIDVRTKGEYDDGHAKGTTHMPPEKISDATIQDLKKYRAVYVICASGNRSAMACSFLERYGVHAVNVEGGTYAWATQGLPME